jgi:hypothetical protein
MHGLTPVRAQELHRTHVIKGAWETRTLAVDGQAITPVMVHRRLRDGGWYAPDGFEQVRTFAWGATATPRELQLLAYGCCEFAVLDHWNRHLTSRFALEQLFTAHLQRLPPADFTLRYGEHELRAAMRRYKRGGKIPYWWDRLHGFLVPVGGEPT